MTLLNLNDPTGGKIVVINNYGVEQFMLLVSNFAARCTIQRTNLATWCLIGELFLRSSNWYRSLTLQTLLWLNATHIRVVLLNSTNAWKP